MGYLPKSHEHLHKALNQHLCMTKTLLLLRQQASAAAVFQTCIAARHLRIPVSQIMRQRPTEERSLYPPVQSLGTSHPSRKESHRVCISSEFTLKTHIQASGHYSHPHR